MSKIVPYRGGSTETLDMGSEVQLAAMPETKALKDNSQETIDRGKAQQNLANTMMELDNELTDAEARNLYNEQHYKIESTQDQYLDLQGKDAVDTIQTEGEGIDKKTVLDEFNNDKLQAIVAEGSEKASSGRVRIMFEKMISNSIMQAQNNMIEHSLNQQRIYKTNEINKSIDIQKTKAKYNYKDWKKPNGNFNTAHKSALDLLEQKASIKGWNTDPNATYPDGSKMPISSQYLAEKSALNLQFAKSAIDGFIFDKDDAGMKDFMRVIGPTLDDESRKILGIEVEEAGTNNASVNKVDAVLSSNGDQNNGDILTIAKNLCGLSSMNCFDDDKGAVVKNGLHSNEINIVDLKDSEFIDALELQRGKSIFFNEDSPKNGKLIVQHHPTHLFAVSLLGTKKADSLYSKALREYKHPLSRSDYSGRSNVKNKSYEKAVKKYNENPDNQATINTAILKKYNELILANASRKYFLHDGTYVAKVENDLGVIESKVNYDVNAESNIEINKKTNLQSKEVYEKKIKETTTNENEQKYEIEKLNEDYNKISKINEEQYDLKFEKAQEIAAEPGGWRKLKENGIEISEFTTEDQALLKQGPPVESDQEVLAELNSDPDKAISELEKNRFKLSPTNYEALKRYVGGLKSSEDKYIEATANKDIMKDVLYKNGYDDLAFPPKGKLKGEDAAKFNSIYTEWIKRIDYAQKISGKKLTLKEKIHYLNNVLLDKVNVKDQGWWSGVPGKKDVLLGAQQNDVLAHTYVNIDVKQDDGSFKTEQIYNSDIPHSVRTAIMASLNRRKIPMTEINVAKEWIKFNKPMSLSEAEEYAGLSTATSDYELLTGD
tara:strand:- start:8704 stop:11199 length:2496 start_codon:yes stop_codon:yes gene_type:complete